MLIKFYSFLKKETLSVILTFQRYEVLYYLLLLKNLESVEKPNFPPQSKKILPKTEAKGK